MPVSHAVGDDCSASVLPWALSAALISSVNLFTEQMAFPQLCSDAHSAPHHSQPGKHQLLVPPALEKGTRRFSAAAQEAEQAVLNFPLPKPI